MIFVIALCVVYGQSVVLSYSRQGCGARVVGRSTKLTKGFDLPKDLF